MAAVGLQTVRNREVSLITRRSSPPPSSTVGRTLRTGAKSGCGSAGGGWGFFCCDPAYGVQYEGERGQIVLACLFLLTWFRWPNFLCLCGEEIKVFNSCNSKNIGCPLSKKNNDWANELKKSRRWYIGGALRLGGVAAEYGLYWG